MGMRDYVTKKLFGAKIESEVQQRLPAAVSTALNTVGWRRLSGAPTRELPMMDQPRAIEVAYWLWKTHPMAKWIIEIVTAFVVAKGTPYSCTNEDVQKVLDDFWYDPVNRMDLAWENFVRELGIYGEQCWPVFIAEQTGRVRLGYVDPAQIEQIYPDPENVRVKVGISISGVNGGKPKRLAIILDDENEAFLSPAGQELRETFTDGQCFYFSINALTNEMRGTSDLFTVSDHVDNYEQLVWNESEKHSRFNAFFYDITVDGADEKKLEDERAKYQPPRTGEAFIHNEKVKSAAISPDLKAEDSEKAARLQRNHILGSMGLPEHWYGGGGDVNRATASEMDDPAKKIIGSRQERTKNMMEVMFDFVISSAVNARYLTGVPEDELYDYEVQTPELSQKDVAKLSTMLRDITTSLVSGETSGYIDKPEAAKAFAFFLAFCGYEYDPEACEIAPEYQDYRKTVDGGQKTVDGGQKTVDGGRKTVDGKQRAAKRRVGWKR